MWRFHTTLIIFDRLICIYFCKLIKHFLISDVFQLGFPISIIMTSFYLKLTSLSLSTIVRFTSTSVDYVSILYDGTLSEDWRKSRVALPSSFMRVCFTCLFPWQYMKRSSTRLEWGVKNCFASTKCCFFSGNLSL